MPGRSMVAQSILCSARCNAGCWWKIGHLWCAELGGARHIWRCVQEHCAKPAKHAVENGVSIHRRPALS